ncbi:unnamed protein product [Rhizophagus irregularis]|nr:unnamed protein product [Rhizophagus irregularis]
MYTGCLWFFGSIGHEISSLDSDLNRQLVFQDTWMHGNLVLVQLDCFQVFENWQFFSRYYIDDFLNIFFGYLNMEYHTVNSWFFL